MCRISSGRSCNFLGSWMGLDAELQLECCGDFTVLSLKRNSFGWHTVACLIHLSSSFGCFCQPVLIYAAPFRLPTILAKEMDCWMRIARSSMAKQRRRLCGAHLPKCFFRGRDVCNVRQCVNMVMVEMRCCQSQLLRWVLVGGH